MSELTEQHITDKAISDGVLAYREMLEAVVEVFGANATNEQVICKAIEAASYGMWRSIMGPKSDERRPVRI